MDRWDLTLVDDEWLMVETGRRRIKPLVFPVVAIAMLFWLWDAGPGGTAQGLVASFAGAGQLPGDALGPCEVTGVIDGDTVDVNCGGEQARVRLLNIDTPERGEPADDAQHLEARDLAGVARGLPLGVVEVGR